MQNKALKSARDAADVVEQVARNIRLIAPTRGIAASSIEELAGDGQWKEIVDRFWRKLAFGTGGLRGRSIGRIVTTAERGAAKGKRRPDLPCVGTNAMNFFNIRRATQGLVAYCHDWFRKEK